MKEALKRARRTKIDDAGVVAVADAAVAALLTTMTNITNITESPIESSTSGFFNVSFTEPSFANGVTDADLGLRIVVGLVVVGLLHGAVRCAGRRLAILHGCRVARRAHRPQELADAARPPLVSKAAAVAPCAAANLLPFILLAGWASVLLPTEPERCFVYGLGVSLAGPAALLVAYAFISWRQRRWFLSGRVLLAGALSLLLLLLLQLLLVVQRPVCAATERLAEFPHTASTGIAMMLNLMPVSSMLYLFLSEAHAPGNSSQFSADYKRTTSLALVVMGLRRSINWPILQGVLSYLLSLSLLALYSIMFLFSGEGMSGLYASITVVLLDIGVALYAAAGLAKQSTLPPIILMVACRLGFVLCGRYGISYIFLVHAVVFFLGGTLIGRLVTTRRFHDTNSRKHRLKRLVKLPKALHLSFKFANIEINIGARGASIQIGHRNKQAARGGRAAEKPAARGAVDVPTFFVRSPSVSQASATSSSERDRTSAESRSSGASVYASAREDSVPTSIRVSSKRSDADKYRQVAEDTVSIRISEGDVWRHNVIWRATPSINGRHDRDTAASAASGTAAA